MKKLKSLLFVSLTFAALVLAGCDKNNQPVVTNEYTINFNSMGGSPVEPIKVKEGEKATKPNNPVKDDATFTAWYEEVGLINEFSFEQPVFKDYTLYAGWADIVFTITFDSLGGSPVDSVSIKKGGFINKPSDPTRDNYEFTGWYEESSLTTLFDFSTAIEKDYTLYAGWEPIAVVLDFKTAVFADVQLCAKEYGDGFVANADSTAHAYLTLKNNFALAKENNAKVLVMDGDIVNNAVPEYYDLFEHALTSVYGSDESDYPEFVWTMGNHEWWSTSESDDANAVTLFKQHARIETDNLIKKSNVKYYLNVNETLPTYYKVVDGIPFISISGENSNGLIGDEMKLEVASWLEEIEELPYVQNGGYIYISYHYPLSFSMTHGHGYQETAGVLEDLLRDYPQAIVFTGHTHYPAVNERTINQKDFTTINIGTSSYSVMDNRSATMTVDESFYNMEGAGRKEDMSDNANFKHEYTPTIQFINTMSDRSTVIDRYFSSDDVEDAVKINGSWNLPAHANKNSFEYTDDRFESSSYAQTIYGADGLSWNQNAEVKFGIKNGRMTVKFPDVNEYHYCEHFKIDVTGNNTKTYDVVSNYYKYNQSPENLYFFLEDLPDGDNYSVKVTAYDYFDNPSLNYLQSNARDDSECVDEIDYALSKTFSDLSTRVNIEDVAPNSASSLEYFYNGVARMGGGATANKLVYTGNKDASEFISLANIRDAEVVIKTKVKNLTNDELTFGLTIVDGKGIWLSDFSNPTKKTVAPSDEWVLLNWNLNELYGLIGIQSISQIGIKVSSSAYDDEGYIMHFLLDDTDIVPGETVEVYRGSPFMAGNDYHEDVDISLDSTFNIDFKFTSPSDTYVNFMLGTWSDWFGYYTVNANGTLGDNYDGISINSLDDGYIRVTVVPNQLTKVGGGNIGNIEAIKLFYIRGGYSTASGYVDFNSSSDADVLRGQSFSAGVNTTVNDLGITDLNTTFVFDVKITSGEGTYMNVCLLDSSWANYLGYFEIYSGGTLSHNYDGVSIETLDDGYYRISINLSQVTTKTGDPATIDVLFIRGDWTTASGYIDLNSAL